MFASAKLFYHYNRTLDSNYLNGTTSNNGKSFLRLASAPNTLMRNSGMKI